jgi:hypothetical protein
LSAPKRFADGGFVDRAALLCGDVGARQYMGKSATRQLSNLAFDFRIGTWRRFAAMRNLVRYRRIVLKKSFFADD